MLYRENMPKLDLHGEDRISAIIKLEQFIKEQIYQEQYEVAIIHGIGKGILRKVVIEKLKKDKRVEKYETDVFNFGCTLVKLKIKL